MVWCDMVVLSVSSCDAQSVKIYGLRYDVRVVAAICMPQLLLNASMMRPIAKPMNILTTLLVWGGTMRMR